MGAVILCTWDEAHVLRKDLMHRFAGGGISTGSLFHQPR
jgi:hypothetical protein